MTAMISKISPPLKSKSGGVYQKIEFITKPFNTWGYTYVSPENYNFENFGKTWVDTMTKLHEEEGSWDTRKYTKRWTLKEVA